MRTHRQPRRRWLLAVAVGVIVVAAAIATGVVVGSEVGEEQATPAGPPAPDVALTDFEGQPVRLADYRGEPLVVNFWASWCVPCLAEMPGFEQVHQRHKGEVAFLGVNLADDPSAALAVVEHTGITYPLARDPQGELFQAFGGLGMPTTVFIAPDGSVVELYTGELTAGQLEEKLTAYFLSG